MSNVILYGPPGAGKGTQAARIVERLGYVQLSTGDLVRAELKSNPDFAARVRALIDAGQLVDQETVDRLVSQFLAHHLNHNIVFDGYPRTLEQARSLDAMLEKNARTINSVIVFKISDDLVIRRISSRLVCRECGKGAMQPAGADEQERGLCASCHGTLARRSDDTVEAVQNRLADYYRETTPLLEYYKSQGLLVEIDAACAPEEVFDSIRQILAQV